MLRFQCLWWSVLALWLLLGGQLAIQNTKYPQDLIFADFIVSRLQIHTEFNTVQVVLCLRRRSFFCFVAVFVIILYIAVCLPNLTPTLFLTSRHSTKSDSVWVSWQNRQVHRLYFPLRCLSFQESSLVPSFRVACVCVRDGCLAKKKRESERAREADSIFFFFTWDFFFFFSISGTQFWLRRMWERERRVADWQGGAGWFMSCAWEAEAPTGINDGK